MRSLTTWPMMSASLYAAIIATTERSDDIAGHSTAARAVRRSVAFPGERADHGLAGDVEGAGQVGVVIDARVTHVVHRIRHDGAVNVDVAVDGDRRVRHVERRRSSAVAPEVDGAGSPVDELEHRGVESRAGGGASRDGGDRVPGVVQDSSATGVRAALQVE